ncbi:MAG: hypothetical protein GYB67_09905, partial [Chloroflexi bacterium]|nr:hypothetical protein [Chloroflexota bacterium]
MRESALNRNIIERLFAAYPDGTIEPLQTIEAGKSQAKVIAVSIQPRRSNLYDGLAFAKIDRQANCERLHWQTHQRARDRDACIKPYIPETIGVEPVGPVDGWSMVLYKPAQATLHSGAPLADLLKASDRYSVDALAQQVALLLDRVLGCWHPHDSDRHQYATEAAFFRALLNFDDKPRQQSLSDRARQHGLPNAHYPVLHFIPGQLSLPNPVAFVSGA